MFNSRAKSRRPLYRQQPAQRIAPAQGQVAAMRGCLSSGVTHPFSRTDENARLFKYEQQVKQAFSHIEPCLQRMSAMQHELNFVEQAQSMARTELGFELPEVLLADSWIKPLDIGRL